MASLTPHEVRWVDADVDVDEEREEGRLLASITPATPEEVIAVLNAGMGDDGRSNWMWVRLPNGDLMLSLYPQGDTYEMVTQTMIRGRI